MMMRFGVAAALAAGIFMAQPAAAQMVTANPSIVANALRANGLAVEVTTDNDGDPRLKTASDGIKFEVWFYNCTEHRDCRSMQYYAGFTESSADTTKLNTWNREHRFGRAYIDSVGDPAVEMDIDLEAGGMSRGLFDDNLKFWLLTMTAFQKYIY